MKMWVIFRTLASRCDQLWLGVLRWCTHPLPASSRWRRWNQQHPRRKRKISTLMQSETPRNFLFFPCVVALNYESSRLNSWPFPLLTHPSPSPPTPTILCFVAWINIVLYLLHINSSYVSSWQWNQSLRDCFDCTLSLFGPYIFPVNKVLLSALVCGFIFFKVGVENAFLLNSEKCGIKYWLFDCEWKAFTLES